VNTQHRVVEPDSHRAWVVTNVIAFVVGGGLAGGLLRFLGQPYYGTAVSAIEAAYVQASSAGLSGAAFGAVLGTAQWLVLRRTFRADWWIPATCLGFALAGAVSGFLSGGSVSTIGPEDGPVPPILGMLIGLPLVLALFGGFQWLGLRRDVDAAGSWAFGNLGGILAGFGLGFVVVGPLGMLLDVLRPTDYPSAKAFVLIGAVAGIVYGAVTWSVLAQLRRRAAPATITTGTVNVASTDRQRSGTS
jgi:hypothetical protein